MSPSVRYWIALGVLLLAAPASGAVSFYTTPNESAFSTQFPSRSTPTFANESNSALTTIVTPQMTATQIAPVYASLLDSTAGFVWTTDNANQYLGRLRLGFSKPVVAASLRYTWTQTGAISGSAGALSATVRSITSQVAEFAPGGLPIKQGWLGVADTGQPFSTIELDFTGLSGDMAFYVYNDGQGGAIEYATAPALAGDYNGDGAVNTSDYNTWRSNYGSAVSLAVGADGNADGLVNAADYTVWRDKLAASPAAAIPEPATLTALAVMTSLVVTKRVAKPAPSRRA